MKFNQSIKLFLSLFLFNKSTSGKLCSLSSKEKYMNPSIYDIAGDYKKPLEFMSEQSLAYWYTDRGSDMNGAKSSLQSFVSGCQGESPVIVVYGMPNKDCDAGESAGGFNSDSSTYKQFINNLKEVASDNSIIILEPDATALTIDGSMCGLSKGYKENLKMAIDELSNKNVYLDVGHWVVIYGMDKIKKLTDFVLSIDSNKKLKGFSLNLSNYRKTEEMERACKDIISASGKDYKCIIDTSRNNNGPSSAGTWCNYKNAGIGISENDPGISSKKSSVVDHYVWIKPAIELDGNCYGNPESYQSNKGAGAIDLEWFKILWDNGYYKNTDISIITNSISDNNNVPSPTHSLNNNAPNPTHSPSIVITPSPAYSPSHSQKNTETISPTFKINRVCRLNSN